MTIRSIDYAHLANHSYKTPERDPLDPSRYKDVEIAGVDYEVIEHRNNPLTGYQGTIYRRIGTGEIVVAHRGTEEIARDGVLTDGGMVLTRANLQAEDAIALTQSALHRAEEHGRRFGKAPEVTVTGHSLGGCLGQVSAHHFGLRGETFNAYGAESLDRRIPEGGDAVINHVMAADPVSAGARHYGQVRVYATPGDMLALSAGDYDGGLLDLRSPVMTTALALGSHSMHHFVNVDGDNRPDRSVLDDPQARQLAARHAPMIEQYRNDVWALRAGLTTVVRGGPGLVRDALDGLLGPLEPGAPARSEQPAPRWSPPRVTPGEARCEPSPGFDAGLDLPRYGTPDLQVPCRPLSLQDDPSAFVERMLAAAQTGDNAGFRQMTRDAANGEAGRGLRTDAITTVDREMEQTAQLAAQQSMAAQEQAAPVRALRMA